MSSWRRRQIGDGTTIQQRTPVQVSRLANLPLLSAGDRHTLGVRGTGSAWAWGHNAYGQLGTGTTRERHVPVRVHRARLGLPT